MNEHNENNAVHESYKARHPSDLILPDSLAKRLNRATSIQDAITSARLRDSLPSIGRGLLSAGILSLSLGSAEATAGGGSISPELTVDKPQTELTAEQTKIVGEVIGIPAEQLENKFKICVPVKPDKNGKYVIYIGQIHAAPLGFPFLTQDDYRQTSIVQRNIYDTALSAVTTNNLSCVFSEGETGEEESLLLKDLLGLMSGKIDELNKKSITSYTEMDFAVQILSTASSSVKTSYSIYHYLQPKIEELKVKIRHSYENGIITPNYTREEILTHTEPNKFPEPPDPYYNGAAFKLLMDGKINKLCPTSNDALEEESEKAAREYIEAEKKYNTKSDQIREKLSQNPDFKAKINRVNEIAKKGRSNSTKEEVDEVLKLYVEIKSRIDQDPDMRDVIEEYKKTGQKWVQIGNDERDKTVFKNFHNYDQIGYANGLQPNHVVIIYGVGHDLSKRLNEYNLSNSTEDIDRGMIELVPIDNRFSITR